jgi:ABC-type bacteriocin/lantibiotic exporter with double-glycine peptidase domain
MSATFTKRDREASRNTHRLFWQANLFGENKLTFLTWLLARPPAMFVYNVLIPFQIAYSLQAIITRHFDLVGHYALNIILLGLLYCVLWTIGGIAISENGRRGSIYLQKKVFENYINKDYEFFNTAYLGSLGLMANRLRDTFNDYCTTILNSFIRHIVIITSSIIIIGYH